MTDRTCPPITNKAFEHNGAFITSAAFLSAHYEMNAECNKQGVVIPWVWNARFAAELAIQACSLALDRGFDKCPQHDFTNLMSCWCEAATKHIGSNQAEINRFKSRFRRIGHYKEIDKHDPQGLWLRYPLKSSLPTSVTAQQLSLIHI